MSIDTAYAIDKLSQARDLLDNEGWCRGTYHNSRGHHCIFGALQVVDYTNHDLLADILKENVDWGDSFPCHLTMWNDAENRRKRDVIRLFDRTIAKLRVNA